MNGGKSIVLTVVALAFASAANADNAIQRGTVAQGPSITTEPGAVSCSPQGIASLTLGSDFTPYMAAGCPEAVRAKALQRLWRLMPASDDLGVDY